jgi:glycyl-tRNA synthetase
MAPTIHSAKLTLSCPLFAADFDPRNNGLLLVGGGGGEGRSGVDNKIASPTLKRKTAVSAYLC